MTTDELRAKFEEWWVREVGPLNFNFGWSNAWLAWQAAHASRDAEVGALIRKYEKRSIYEDGGLYSNIIDDLQELLGK